MTPKQVLTDLHGRILHWQQNVSDPDLITQHLCEFLAGLAVRNGIGETIGYEVDRFLKVKAGTLKGHATTDGKDY